MSAELIPLPNLNTKILRPNLKTAKEFIFAPVFQGFNFLKLIKNLETETFEILLLILSLFYSSREKDNLLYFNTDDILILRSIKKNKTGKTGYKKKIRKRIKEKTMSLSKLKFFTIINYKDFNFILSPDNLPENPEFITLSGNIFNFNLYKESWHKKTSLFLNYLRFQKKKETFNVQIKKIFEFLNYSNLKPYEIRERFENMLDYLCFNGIIKSWHYFKIDEENLNCKNWFQIWIKLSIKISF